MTTKTLLTCLFLSLFLAPNAFAAHLSEFILISARMSGDQEVPAVSTNATGVTSVMLNRTRDTLCVNMTVTGLSGPITGAHFHRGQPGMSGPVVLPLTSYVSGNRITATLTGTDINAALISELLNGQLYINVHTAMHPGGEIRGQLTVESDYSFVGLLSGAQEVPAVATGGAGVAVFNLSQDQSVLKFHAVVTGLSSAITGAHLHVAPFGANGPVALDLMPFMTGNVISGSLPVAGLPVVAAMNLGTVYINVHTTNNGGGEIRAQLMQPVGKLLFDARLDAAQEVPATASPAQGSATVWLNTTFDTLWYEVVAHGLTGPITAAHFHDGPPGMSGGVILGMNGISGSRVSGMAAGANLTDEFIAKLLRGETYINLHTAMFGGGEIRGQVYRLAREGYTFQMNGGQEVPANNSAAYGSGLVSIDRDQTNAHYMVVYDGVTATAGHFHKAVAGTNGGVIFPLDLANNSAFGYWDATDAPPFTLANSVQFRNDSVYVNIHSAAFPGGEIRGQVERGFVCFAQTSGVEALPPFLSAFELFPNPVSDQLVLRLRSERPETVLITLTDAMGRVTRSFRQDLLAGQQDYPLNLGELPGGFYSISLRQGGEVVTRKFFKE